jgi:hypothetical protein
MDALPLLLIPNHMGISDGKFSSGILTKTERDAMPSYKKGGQKEKYNR